MGRIPTARPLLGVPLPQSQGDKTDPVGGSISPQRQSEVLMSRDFFHFHIPRRDRSLPLDHFLTHLPRFQEPMSRLFRGTRLSRLSHFFGSLCRLLESARVK